MSAAVLLEILREQGVKVTPNGAKLHIEAPPDVLTPNILADLKRLKPEILKVLSTQPPALPHGSPVTLWNLMEPPRSTSPARPDFNSGAADNPAQSTLEELPPALIERPGLDLGPDGLWRWRGFIVLTKGTRPALAKYLEKREKSRHLVKGKRLAA